MLRGPLSVRRGTYGSQEGIPPEKGRQGSCAMAATACVLLLCAFSLNLWRTTRMGMKAFTKMETARLVLRRLRDEDLGAFMAYLNDPLVARYQSWESYTEREAREVIERQRGFEPGTPGQW